MQTADAISFASELEVQLAPEIAEVNFGDLSTADPAMVDEVRRSWLSESGRHLRASGRESYEEVVARALPFLQQTVARYANFRGLCCSYPMAH